MAKIEDVTFTGLSGAQYAFVAYTLDTTFNDVVAVYVFAKQVRAVASRSYHPLYTGQTEELNNRYVNHEKWPCVNQNGVNSICVLREDNEDRRFAIETDLIRNQNAPCND